MVGDSLKVCTWAAEGTGQVVSTPISCQRVHWLVDFFRAVFVDRKAVCKVFSSSSTVSSAFCCSQVFRVSAFCFECEPKTTSWVFWVILRNSHFATTILSAIIGFGLYQLGSFFNPIVEFDCDLPWTFFFCTEIAFCSFNRKPKGLTAVVLQMDCLAASFRVVSLPRQR